MAFGAIKKILLGFCIGILFIILSGLLIGGILFADFLLGLNLTNNFIIFGIPYGFVSGLLYWLLLKFMGAKGDIIRRGFLFGIGFWLSFSTLYIIMYFAFSRFQAL